MATKPLEPNLWKLEDVFRSIYNVPVYQRPYSWGDEQVDTLLKDIFEAYRSPDKYDGYYTGNMIVHDKDEKINGLISKYDIIDGQQRITTFALILLSIYSISHSREIPAEDKTLTDVKAALWKIVNREFKREHRAVNLNSIEKKCFAEIYDFCFDHPKDLIAYVTDYPCSSRFEELVVANLKNIYRKIDEAVPETETESILDFADYLLQYVQFIVINTTGKEHKAFSMFESINSKGKRLEEIDLIKTYIFSNLDENSYERYLNIWGQLIIRTHDNLYDYLYNYIKAYLSFYRNNINITNFKAISKKELCTYFNEPNVSEALKKLLDDMYKKVDFYNMLSSVDAAYALVKSGEFRFFYKIFTDIAYKHPKALFLRTLIEFSEHKISKPDAVAIIVETVKFMVKFLTIESRSSKDAITLFSFIMNDIYQRNGIDRTTVVKLIASELIKQGVTPEKLKSQLSNIDAYDSNKKLSVAMLSLYEATTFQNNRIKISYDQAYTVYDDYGTTFSLDHLLVQTPDPASTEYKYYKNEATGNLALKEGHDFPSALVVDGMDYDLFTQLILNRLGNLRIYYKDKNSVRQNCLIQLKDYGSFTSYQDILKRNEELTKVIVDEFLKDPSIDITDMQALNYRKMEAALPKMDKLIEFGLVKPGDKLYITLHPEESVATLLDEKYVDFNGEKITLNEWGCKITGWQSIRIYAYAAVVGETDTLQQKRIDYINDADSQN